MLSLKRTVKIEPKKNFTINNEVPEIFIELEL